MFKKVIIGGGVILLLLGFSIVVIPFVVQHKLQASLNEEIHNRINADVHYNNFGVSIIRQFPNLSLSLENIVVTGTGEFKGDTLAFIKRIDMAIDWMSFIKGSEYKIQGLNIVEPDIKAKMNVDGKGNWDVLKTTTGGSGGNYTPSAYSIMIEKYNIREGKLNYANERSKVTTQIHRLNVEGSGKVTNDLYDMKIRESSAEFTYIGGDSVSGSVNFSLNFKGLKSDIQEKKYEAIHTSGNIKIKDLYYSGSEIALPIHVPELQAKVTTESITVDSMETVIGKSDIAINGTITNYVPYLANKGDLTGMLNIRSKTFYIRDWKKKNNAASENRVVAANAALPDTSHKEAFKIPAHIELTINPYFGKIFCEKLTIENAKGQLLVKDEAVNLDDVSADLLGGSAILSGKYSAKNTDHPVINFSYGVKNISIQQAYNSIKAISEVAPGIKYVSGNCRGNIKGSCKLNPNMSVDSNSLVGEGKIDLPNTKVAELPVLDEIYKVAKIPSLKNLELKNTPVEFNFRNGRIYIKPAELKFTNGYNMYLQGSSGFDQTVNYNIKLDVPAKEIVASSPLAQNILSLIPGISNSLPKRMNLVFKVSGNAVKPEVKLIKVE